MRRQAGSGRSVTQGARARQGARDELMLAVLMQFRVIVRSIRKHYAQVERQCGVSGAQLWAMAQIDSASGIKVGELARALAVHQSTASNLLDALDRAGLTARRRTADDQRVVRVYLTEQGKRVLRRAPRPLRGALQEALAHVSATRLRALHADLAQLIRHMQRDGSAQRSMAVAEMLGNDAHRLSQPARARKPARPAAGKRASARAATTGGRARSG